MNTNSIKTLVYETLIEENLSHEESNLIESEVDFAINFEYPPTTSLHPDTEAKTMVILKPKLKNVFILSIAVQVSEEHALLLRSIDHNALDSYFLNLRKYFLLKDVFYDFPEELKYEINDKIYIDQEKNNLKQTLLESMRRIYNCYIYSNVLLTEMLLTTSNRNEVKKSKDFSSRLDYSLYI